MSFVQERTPAGETRMLELTRQLIDAALEVGGAYPAWRSATRAKAEHDPAGLFRNTFYDRYRSA
jgi:hypothetical protein